MRTGGQSSIQSQTMEHAKQASLEDNLETDDGMMYDDAGLESRVIGGTKSTVQWPWMLSEEFKYSHFILQDHGIINICKCRN